MDIITKEMIKLLPEGADYGTVPTYASISAEDRIVVDAKNFKADPNHNIINEETLYEQDVVESEAGVFTMDGSVTIPVRMSQFGLLNYIGFGKTINIDLYDNNAKVGKQSVAVPTSKLMPSYTMCHLITEPEIMNIYPGTVFTNYKLSFNISDFVMSTINFASQTFNTVKSTALTGENLAKATVEPLPKADLVRALDLCLYADLDIIPFDAAYEGGRDVIEVIYAEEGADVDEPADGIPNVSAPAYMIVGDLISNVKSMDLSLSTTTFSDDPHRFGSRFAKGYPMKKVKKHNYGINFAIDYEFDENDDNKIYNRFVNGATRDSTGVIAPTECGIGRFSLVAKIGSVADMAPLASGEETTSNPYGPTQLQLTDLADPLAPVKAAPNRTSFIMPNVLLESTSLDSSVGAIKDLAFSARLLPDPSDGIFENVVVGGETLKNTRIAALTINKI